jgi:hypothetical protein
MTDNTSLLDAIIASEPTADLEATKVTPKTRTVTTDDGITWAIDDEGNGTRLTPASSRGRPVAMTRKFPPLVPTEQRNLQAMFAAVAADPLKAQKLATLLAHDVSDRRAAHYLLGSQWQITPEEADLVVSVYLAVKERMK